MKTKTVTHAPKKVLPGIVLAVFVESLTTSVFVPSVVIGLDEASGAGIAAIASIRNYAVLVAVHLVLQFFAAPLIGQYSDRFGRRIALWFSLSGAAAGNAIFFYGATKGNFDIMLLGRGIDGLTGGTQAIARSIIADVAHNSTRVQYFGLLGGVFGIGSILGTILGMQSAFVADLHKIVLVSPFGFAVMLSALNVLLAMAFIPETYRVTRRWNIHWAHTVRFIIQASRARSHRILFATTFLYLSGASLLLSFIPFVLQNTVGYSVRSSEEFVLFVLVASSVAQAVIAPFLARMVRSHRALRGSIVATLVSLPFAAILGPGSISPLVFGVVFAVPYGITLANLPALVSGTSSKELQGEILGIDVAMHAAGQLLPVVVAFWINGRAAMPVLLVAAGMLVMSAVLFVGHYRTPAYALKVNKV